MHRTGLLTTVAVAIVLVGCSKTTTERLQLPQLEVVPQVELERYLGTWYEIASYPQRWQEGCTGTTATYTLRSDGEIDVLNKCRKGSLDGPEDVAEGRARVVDSESNAKLADETHAAILSRLEDKGYPLERLEKTKQPAG